MARSNYENDKASPYRRGKSATRLYRELILEFSGCSEDETGGVEAVMRDSHPTLDHLSRDEFRHESRVALEVLRYDLWQLPRPDRRWAESVSRSECLVNDKNEILGGVCRPEGFSGWIAFTQTRAEGVYGTEWAAKRAVEEMLRETL